MKMLTILTTVFHGHNLTLMVWFQAFFVFLLLTLTHCREYMSYVYINWVSLSMGCVNVSLLKYPPSGICEVMMYA